ncbi:MAG: histidinol-phosphate transaminase [Lachnospiraceae bacterium]|nr:histidinol-phosphate transaminase [Lachnospiraceae bacterium]
MSKWEENIRRVTPYTPGEQPNRPGMIKLNTNENPYPPAPGVTGALRALKRDELLRYPDPTASALTGALAREYGVSPEQIFVGVGSDDVLAMAFMTFFNSGRPILFPDITYSFYPVWAEEFRIPYECVPLDADFGIRKEDYFRENGGIVFPNPNAPTGVELAAEDVEEIIRRNPDVVVIVDEAYVDFGAHSALRLVEKYDNLLVVQTFSKSRSMAGMRIGFAVGNPALIRYLNDVKYSFNSYTMNRAALACGVAALEDRTYFEETTKKIIETRENAKRVLREMGFCFPDSQANFLFITHPELDAKKLFEALRAADIYVRYFAQPRIDSYLRVTIGTDDQMEALYRFLRDYTKGLK